MKSINELLKTEERIKIDDLLLDPNNPRFTQHTDDRIPESRIADPEVQKKAFEEMLHQRNNFEIDELVGAIMADGFIEVDKIFVSKLGSKYLVIEGNRRVTALKTIAENHKNSRKGFEELPAGLSETLHKIPCVVVDRADKAETDQLIRKILGLRHHGSILPWKPLPASYNLYDVYMVELCDGNPDDAKNPDKFIYVPAVAKKVAAMFSVKLTEVRKKVRLYRTYRQLADASNNHANVIRPDSFSMIEETLSSKKLQEYFGYDEHTALLSEDGIERALDLYFGLRGNAEVITQASAGNSNVRDFAYVVAEGTEEDIKRITESREKASIVSADVEAKRSHRNLQSALELVFEILGKINLGEISLGGFAPIELEHLNNIERKLSQLKAAANSQN